MGVSGSLGSQCSSPGRSNVCFCQMPRRASRFSACASGDTSVSVNWASNLSEDELVVTDSLWRFSVPLPSVPEFRHCVSSPGTGWRAGLCLLTVRMRAYLWGFQLSAERRCLPIRFPTWDKSTGGVSFALAPSQALKRQFRFSFLHMPLGPNPASLCFHRTSLGTHCPLVLASGYLFCTGQPPDTLKWVLVIF